MRVLYFDPCYVPQSHANIRLLPTDLCVIPEAWRLASVLVRVMLMMMDMVPIFLPWLCASRPYESYDSSTEQQMTPMSLTWAG